MDYLQSVDSTLIHGTHVLGKPKDKVTRSDIESISCDLNTEAHLIRHFVSLPEEYLLEVKNKTFMRYDIRLSKHVSAYLDDVTLFELLATQGSKFFPNLSDFSTPRNVFNQAITHCLASLSQDTFWIAKGDRDVAYFLLNTSKPIGTQNVIKLNTLSTELRKRVFTRPRGTGGDAITINFVRTKPPETNVMVIMLQRTREGCKLETAYPGIIVTDQPQPTIHSKTELALCKTAWDGMAFVTSE